MRWVLLARLLIASSSWRMGTSSKRTLPTNSSRTRRAIGPRTSSPNFSPTDLLHTQHTKETIMRRTRTLAGLGIAAATLLALTACNSGSPSTPGGDGGEEGGDKPLFEVATDVSLEGSPTYDAMVERGGPVIGVKEDQPNLGYLD